MSETRGPTIGGPGPASSGSTLVIRPSNPCRWTTALGPGTVVPLGVPNLSTCVVLADCEYVVIAVKTLGPRSLVRHRTPLLGTQNPSFSLLLQREISVYANCKGPSQKFSKAATLPTLTTLVWS
jgi:hypothetical protein